MDPKWTTPIVNPDRLRSWFKDADQSPPAMLGVLRCAGPEGPLPARQIYRRVIERVLKPAGQIGNGYHDFEGPLAALRRLDLIEVTHFRRPSPGEVSPSCVGAGTWSVMRESPITWECMLTDLGEEVRSYWLNRCPYTGEKYSRPKWIWP